MNLADHLHAAIDDEIGALLQRRPDLAVPIPADIGQLAGRVQSRVSVARALDGLDLFTLEVLDGLRYVRGEDGVCPVDALLALCAEAGAEPVQVQSALARLRELWLIYRPDASDGYVRLVAAIDDLLGPYPAGLGRPADRLVKEAAKIGRSAPVDAAALAADPAGLRRMVLSAPPAARAVLDRLAEGPPVGQVALQAERAEPRSTEPAGSEAGDGSPVRWLLDHGLLVATADDLVELPREIGIVLRRDTGPLGRLHPTPPPLATKSRPGRDEAGAGQAMDAVRHLDALLGSIGEAPPPVLRSGGGLGVRELRRLARATGLDETTTALLLEIAACAGLLSTGPAPGSTSLPYGPVSDERWMPTPAYDAWRAGPIARQWAQVARAWLSMARAPALVGQRDDKGKVIGALSLDAVRARAPEIRRATLEVLASDEDGGDAESVLARLAWQYPRRYGRGAVSRAAGVNGTATDLLARAALREAATLGVTGLDAMTSYGQVLLSEQPDLDDDPLGINAPDWHSPAGTHTDAVIAALDRLLPAPVDHVLVQADLTVIIPGPPEPTLAAELAAVADAESRGGATVYRVTPTSVRRALDVGYAPADLHALFQRRSRTPLPQTLAYLIDDVARRHGGLRVGSAGAYLRGDDESLLTEVLADRRLAGLALRRLAPTVLATQQPPARLLEALRDAGYAPVAEDAAGAVVLTRPTASRAPLAAVRMRPYAEDPERARLTGPRLAAVVEQIRRGDRIARAARRSPLSKPPVAADGTPVTSAQAHAQALAVLRQGITERKKVWVGFVDAHGSTGSRLVRPVSMGGGFLHAEDDRSQTRHTFALHRITAAAFDS